VKRLEENTILTKLQLSIYSRVGEKDINFYSLVINITPSKSCLTSKRMHIRDKIFNQDLIVIVRQCQSQSAQSIISVGETKESFSESMRSVHTDIKLL